MGVFLRGRAVVARTLWELDMTEQKRNGLDIDGRTRELPQALGPGGTLPGSAGMRRCGARVSGTVIEVLVRRACIARQLQPAH